MKKAMIHRRTMSRDDRVFDFFLYAIILLLTLVCVYPLYFTIIASISDPHAVYTGKVGLLPVGFSLEAYTTMLQNDAIWRGYGNTIFYTVGGTLLNLFLTIPCAYALSRKQMYGRTVITWIFLFTMYFGGGMIPTYILFKNLELINTPWIMILVGGVSIYNVVVTRVFFQNSIPESLYEAARIDGANELKIFWRLVLPLSGPIFAVMALFYAVSHWNSYFDAMIYLTKTKYQPLSLVLRRILILNETAYEQAMLSDSSAEAMALAAKQAYTAATMKYSLVFVASFPMLVAYPFVQKFFVKGVMIGSLKG